MNCPNCESRGYNIGVACPGFQPVKMTCEVCGGAGRCTQDDIDRLEKGHKMREDRIARHVSLRVEAKRLRLTPVQLSRLERGLKDEEGMTSQTAAGLK